MKFKDYILDYVLANYKLAFTVNHTLVKVEFIKRDTPSGEKKDFIGLKRMETMLSPIFSLPDFQLEGIIEDFALPHILRGEAAVNRYMDGCFLHLGSRNWELRRSRAVVDEDDMLDTVLSQLQHNDIAWDYSVTYLLFIYNDLNRKLIEHQTKLIMGITD